MTNSRKKQLKFLYVTDLHGDSLRYDRILNIAKDHGISVIINGGDMLPHHNQEHFLTSYLEKYFSTLDDYNIQYVCMFGNDDERKYDELFNNMCSSYKNIHNMVQRKVELFGYEIIGMNYVTDYPFRLKDRCRLDQRNSVLGPQFGTPLFSKVSLDSNGYIEFSHEQYFDYLQHSVSTIEEELQKLPKPTNRDKCIYVFHNPPSKLGLDVCMDYRQVGSDSILEFLCSNPCFCSLHGHIHESPYVTKQWYNVVTHDTVVIQPGQYGELSYVIIETEKQKFTKFPEKVKFVKKCNPYEKSI